MSSYTTTPMSFFLDMEWVRLVWMLVAVRVSKQLG